MNGITAVSPLTGRQIHLPILNNLLIDARTTQITITGTNLEATIIAVVRGMVEIEGSYTIPAKTIAEYVGLLPAEARIECEMIGTELQIKSGKQKAKIKGSPATEFPTTPTNEGVTTLSLPADQLKKAIQRTLVSVSHSEVRPELQGVYMFSETNDALRVVFASTDSYRLTEVYVDLLSPAQTVVRAILPQRTAQEISRVLPTDQTVINLILSEGQISCSIGDVIIISRLIDGNYPDYRQIIPKEWKTEVSVPTEETHKAIRAAALFATQGVNAVSVHIAPEQEKMIITSASSLSGEQSAEISLQGTGDENTVTLNQKFLQDGLSFVGEERSVIKIVNAESPCVVKPEKADDYLYIIMPIRQ